MKNSHGDSSIVFYDMKESARKVTRPADTRSDCKKTSPRDSNQMKYQPVMNFGDLESRYGVHHTRN